MNHPGLISVDDHIVEDPGLFDRFDPKNDCLPRWTKQGEHCGWRFGSRFYGISKAATAAGQPWGQAGIFVPSETVPEGLDDPRARLRAMDADGIAMSMCFPSMMGLGGETPTRELLAKAIDENTAIGTLHAYNRFVLEDWYSTDKSRFIPAIALPLWDPALAAKWVEDPGFREVKAVLFPQAPHQIGLPPVWSPAWAPLFNACDDFGIVIAQHIFSDDSEQYTAGSLPPYLPLTLARTSAIETIAAWILTPALDACPGLKIMVAESGVGWIPWFLNLANESARLHAFEFGKLKMNPLERMEQHFGISLLSEPFAAGTIESLPRGLQTKLMFESDYPHLDGSFPHSRAAFASMDLPPALRRGVARDNAIAFFGLENPYEFPSLVAARSMAFNPLPRGFGDDACGFEVPANEDGSGGWICLARKGHEPPHVGPKTVRPAVDGECESCS